MDSKENFHEYYEQQFSKYNDKFLQKTKQMGELDKKRQKIIIDMKEAHDNQQNNVGEQDDHEKMFDDLKQEFLGITQKIMLLEEERVGIIDALKKMHNDYEEYCEKEKKKEKEKEKEGKDSSSVKNNDQQDIVEEINNIIVSQDIFK